MAKPKSGPRIKLPPGYRLVEWAHVHNGEIVYLLGTHKEQPHAYGPHEVVDPAAKTLKNVARQESFTADSCDRLLYRDGPTVVVTLSGGGFRSLYADVPLDVFVVASSSGKPEINASQYRAKGIQSVPDETSRRIARAAAKSPNQVQWPPLYGKYEIADAMMPGPPPFQMRTVMMSNQLALNALILYLVRKGQEFTCTPKCEGGEVTMSNYAWQAIAREFEDLVEGASHVVK